MSYYDYSYSKKDISFGYLLLAFICLCIFVVLLDSCSISNDRENQHMVTIYESDNLVYNQDTFIVYREEIISGGRYASSATYSVYYNSNGNKCKYINGEIMEIENSGGE